MDDLLVLREDDSVRLEVQKVTVGGVTVGGVTVLFCQSAGRREKEEGIKTRMQQRFEAGLDAIAASLKKAKGIKRYERKGG